MRIVMDATPLLGSPTGVGATTSGLIEALSALDGLQVDYYALSTKGPRVLPGRVPADRVASRAPMPAGVLTRLWKRVSWPVVEYWTGRAELVHGTNFVVPPARSAARLVTVHDLTSVHFPQMCTSHTLRYPALVARAVRTGAHVHVMSQTIAAEVVAAFDVEPSRVHVVPPGVPVVPEVARNGENTGVPYVLALGTIEPRKDYPTLIKAFDEVAGRLGDLRLKIAGGTGWSEGEFERAVAAAQHGYRIDVLGRVDAAQRAGLLRGASALVYPSIYEGFGLPPLESMAVGVPVVATRAGAVPEVVGDAALLADPGDVAGLAARIAQVIEDNQLRKTLITAGEQRVAAYSWQRMGMKMAQVYKSLGEES